MLFTFPNISAAEGSRRDGNWWLAQNRSTHAEYVIGFFDGMDLGHNFSFWALIKDKEMNVCIGKIMESYAEFDSKYFKNITNGQVVDGLNSFYADFRNRSIRVADAVWLVVNAIAGTPQEELDTMIEKWRRIAH